MESLFACPNTGNLMKPYLLAILVTCFLTHVAVAQKPSAKTPAALDFQTKSLDGKKIKLSKYAGKVVVFVNVASKCGFTNQYEALQKLHDKHGSKGLAIVGVPCNQFGGQEPGSEKEIAEFCKKNYGVKFDMLAKVDVKGKKQLGLYKHLTSLDLKPAGKGDIKWNFEKFVLDRTGTPIARFDSKTKPTSKEFVSVIDDALAADSSGHYSHVSKKLGRTYFLFKKEVPLKNSDKVQTIYYFAKDKNNAKGVPLASVPDDKVVSETKTGMLVLKKK